MSAAHSSVFLCGDLPLLREFGELCLAASRRVTCRANTPGALPAQFRRSATVPRAAALAVELTNLDRAAKRRNLLQLDRALPAGTIILSSSITVSAAEQASWLRRPERLVGFGAMPSLVTNGLLEVAPTVHTGSAAVAAAREFLTALGKETAVVQDRVGMVMPRILCQLINEAFFAVGEQVASAEEIDLAMKLGTGYPHGPIAWAHAVGLETVIAVLTAIQVDLGESRYRLAPLMRQLAHSGSWKRT